MSAEGQQVAINDGEHGGQDMRTPAQLALAALSSSANQRRSSAPDRLSATTPVPSSSSSSSHMNGNDTKVSNSSAASSQLKSPPPRASFTRSPMALLPITTAAPYASSSLTVSAYSQPSSPTHGNHHNNNDGSNNHIAPYTDGGGGAIRWPTGDFSSHVAHSRSPAPRPSTRQTKDERLILLQLNESQMLVARHAKEIASLQQQLTDSRVKQAKLKRSYERKLKQAESNGAGTEGAEGATDDISEDDDDGVDHHQVHHDTPNSPRVKSALRRIDDLAQSLADSNAYVLSQASSIDVLLSEKASLQQALSATEAAVRLERDRGDHSDERNRQQAAAMRQLQMDNAALKAQSGREIGDERDRSLQAQHGLAAQLAESERQKGALENDMAERDRIMRIWQNEQAAVEAELRDQAAQIVTRDQQIDALRLQVAALEAALAELRATAAPTVSSPARPLPLPPPSPTVDASLFTAAQQRMSELERANDALRAELASGVAARQADNQSMLQQLTAARAEQDATLQKLHAAEADLKQSRDAHDDTVKQAAAKEAAAPPSSLIEDHKQLAARVTSLQASLNDAQTTARNATAEMERLQRELDKQKAENDEWRKKSVREMVARFESISDRERASMQTPPPIPGRGRSGYVRQPQPSLPASSTKTGGGTRSRTSSGADQTGAPINVNVTIDNHGQQSHEGKRSRASSGADSGADDDDHHDDGDHVALAAHPDVAAAMAAAHAATKRARHEREKSFADLKQQLDAEKATMEQWQEAATQATEQAEKAMEDLNHTRELLAACEAKNATQATRIEALEKEVADLQSKLRALTAVNARLSSSADEAAATASLIDRHQATIQRLEDEAVTAHSEHIEQLKAISDAEQHLSDAQDEAARLREEILQLKDQLDEKDHALNDANDATQQANQAAKEAEQHHHDEVEQLRHELDELKNALDTLRGQHTDAVANRDRVTNDMATANDTIQQQRQQLDKANERLNDITKRLADTEAKHAQAARDKDASASVQTDTIDRLVDQVAKLQAKVKSQTDEIGALNDTIATKDKDHDSDSAAIARQLDGLRQQVADLQRQLKDMTTAKDHLSDQLDQATTNSNRAQASLADTRRQLDDQIAALTSATASSSAREVLLRGELERANEALEALRGQAGETRGLSELNAELTADKAMLQQRLADRQRADATATADWNTKVAALEAAKQALQADKKELESQLDAVLKSASAVKADLARLQDEQRAMKPSLTPDEIAALKSQLASANDEVHAAHERDIEHQHVVQQLHHDHDTQCNDLNDKIKQLSAGMNQLQADKQRLAEDITALEASLRDQTQRADNDRQQAKAAADDHTQTIDRLVDQVAKLQARIKELSNAPAPAVTPSDQLELEQKLRQLIADNERLLGVVRDQTSDRQRANELQTELDDALQRVRALTADNDRLANVTRDHTADRQRANEQQALADKLRGDVDTLQQQLHGLTEENQRLDQLSQQQRDALTTADQNARDGRDTIQNLKTELAAARAAVTAMPQLASPIPSSPPTHKKLPSGGAVANAVAAVEEQQQQRTPAKLTRGPSQRSLDALNASDPQAIMASQAATIERLRQEVAELQARLRALTPTTEGGVHGGAEHDAEVERLQKELAMQKAENENMRKQSVREMVNKFEDITAKERESMLPKKKIDPRTVAELQTSRRLLATQVAGLRGALLASTAAQGPRHVAGVHGARSRHGSVIVPATGPGTTPMNNMSATLPPQKTGSPQLGPMGQAPPRPEGMPLPAAVAAKMAAAVAAASPLKPVAAAPPAKHALPPSALTATSPPHSGSGRRASGGASSLMLPPGSPSPLGPMGATPQTGAANPSSGSQTPPVIDLSQAALQPHEIKAGPPSPSLQSPHTPIEVKKLPTPLVITPATWIAGPVSPNDQVGISPNPRRAPLILELKTSIADPDHAGIPTTPLQVSGGSGGPMSSRHVIRGDFERRNSGAEGGMMMPMTVEPMNGPDSVRSPTRALSPERAVAVPIGYDARSPQQRAAAGLPNSPPPLSMTPSTSSGGGNGNGPQPLEATLLQGGLADGAFEYQLEELMMMEEMEVVMEDTPIVEDIGSPSVAGDGQQPNGAPSQGGVASVEALEKAVDTLAKQKETLQALVVAHLARDNAILRATAPSAEASDRQRMEEMLSDLEKRANAAIREAKLAHERASLAEQGRHQAQQELAAIKEAQRNPAPGSEGKGLNGNTGERLAAAQAAVAMLQKEKSLLASQVANSPATKEARDAEAARQAAEQKLAEAEKRLSALQKDLSKEREARKAADAEVAAGKSVMADAEQHIIALEGERQRLANECDQLAAELDRVAPLSQPRPDSAMSMGSGRQSPAPESLGVLDTTTRAQLNRAVEGLLHDKAASEALREQVKQKEDELARAQHELKEARDAIAAAQAESKAERERTQPKVEHVANHVAGLEAVVAALQAAQHGEIPADGGIPPNARPLPEIMHALRTGPPLAATASGVPLPPAAASSSVASGSDAPLDPLTSSSSSSAATSPVRGSADHPQPFTRVPTMTGSGGNKNNSGRLVNSGPGNDRSNNKPVKRKTAQHIDDIVMGDPYSKHAPQRVKIRIDMDHARVSSPSDRAAFETKFVGDIADALKVPQSRFTIVDVVGGSVIVTLQIEAGDPSAMALALQLRKMLGACCTLVPMDDPLSSPQPKDRKSTPTSTDSPDDHDDDDTPSSDDNKRGGKKKGPSDKNNSGSDPDNDELAQQMAAVKEKAATLADENSRLHDSLANAQAQVAAADASLTDARNQLDKALAGARDAAQQASLADSKAQRADQRAKDAEAKLAAMDAKLAAADTKCKQAEAAANDAEDRIAKLTSELDRAHRTADDAVTNGDQTLAGVREQLKAARDEATDAMKRARTLEQGRSAAEQARIAAATAHDQAVSEMKKAVENAADARAALTDAEALVTTKDGLIDRLNNDIGELQAKIKALTAVNQRLQASADDHKQQNHQLRVEQAKLEEHLAAIGPDLEQLENTKVKLQSANEKLRGLQSKMAENDARAAGRAAEAQRNYNDDKAALEAQIANLQQARAAHEQVMRDAEQQVAVLMKKHQAQGDQLLAADSKAADLQVALDRARNTNHDLTQSMNQLQSDLARLTATAAERARTIEQLSNDKHALEGTIRDNESLRPLLQEQIAANTALQQQSRADKSLADRLQAEHATLQAELRALQTKVTEQARQIGAHDAEVDQHQRLERKLADVEQRLKTAQDELDGPLRADGTRNPAGGWRQQRSDMDNTIAALRRERDSLIDAAELQQGQARRDAMEADHERANKLRQLQEENNTLHAELKLLGQAIAAGDASRPNANGSEVSSGSLQQRIAELEIERGELSRRNDALSSLCDRHQLTASQLEMRVNGLTSDLAAAHTKIGVQQEQMASLQRTIDHMQHALEEEDRAKLAATETPADRGETPMLSATAAALQAVKDKLAALQRTVQSPMIDNGRRAVNQITDTQAAVDTVVALLQDRINALERDKGMLLDMERKRRTDERVQPAPSLPLSSEPTLITRLMREKAALEAKVAALQSKLDQYGSRPGSAATTPRGTQANGVGSRAPPAKRPINEVNELRARITELEADKRRLEDQLHHQAPAERDDRGENDLEHKYQQALTDNEVLEAKLAAFQRRIHDLETRPSLNDSLVSSIRDHGRMNTNAMDELIHSLEQRLADSERDNVALRDRLTALTSEHRQRLAELHRAAEQQGARELGSLQAIHHHTNTITILETTVEQLYDQITRAGMTPVAAPPSSTLSTSSTAPPGMRPLPTGPAMGRRSVPPTARPSASSQDNMLSQLHALQESMQSQITSLQSEKADLEARLRQALRDMAQQAAVIDTLQPPSPWVNVDKTTASSSRALVAAPAGNLSLSALQELERQHRAVEADKHALQQSLDAQATELENMRRTIQQLRDGGVGSGVSAIPPSVNTSRHGGLSMDDLADLRATISEQQQLLEEQAAAADQHQVDVAELHASLASLRATNTTLTARIRDLEQQLRDMPTHAISSQQSHLLSTPPGLDIGGRLRRSEAARAELEEQLSSRQQQIASLQSALDTSQRHARRAETAATAAAAASTHPSVHSLRAEVQSLTATNITLTTRVTEHDNRVRQLQADNQSLRDQIAATQRRNNTLERDLRQAHDHVRHAEADATAARATATVAAATASAPLSDADRIAQLQREQDDLLAKWSEAVAIHRRHVDELQGENHQLNDTQLSLRTTVAHQARLFTELERAFGPSASHDNRPRLMPPPTHQGTATAASRPLMVDTTAPVSQSAVMRSDSPSLISPAVIIHQSHAPYTAPPARNTANNNPAHRPQDMLDADDDLRSGHGGNNNTAPPTHHGGDDADSYTLPRVVASGLTSPSPIPQQQQQPPAQPPSRATGRTAAPATGATRREEKLSSSTRGNDSKRAAVPSSSSAARPQQSQPHSPPQRGSSSRGSNNNTSSSTNGVIPPPWQPSAATQPSQPSSSSSGSRARASAAPASASSSATTRATNATPYSNMSNDLLTIENRLRTLLSMEDIRHDQEVYALLAQYQRLVDARDPSRRPIGTVRAPVSSPAAPRTRTDAVLRFAELRGRLRSIQAATNNTNTTR